MKFIRWGSLKPQYHNIDERTFHTPPVNNGIYAFPIGYVEPFLLGGVGSGSLYNGRYHFLKDENGNRIKDIQDNVIVYQNTHKRDKYGDDIFKYVVTDKYRDLFKKLNIDADKVKSYVLEAEDDETITGDESYDYDSQKETYFVVENDPIKFNYSGNIWCHFNEYVKRNEILREVGDWILVDMKLYEKLLKKVTYADKRKRVINHKGDYGWGGILEHNSISGYPISYMSKDMYEVFIEKV